MSDQHVGVRRRAPRVPLRRVVPLVAGLAMVVWALSLGDPGRPPGPAGTIVPPTWTGPATVDLAGVLADGSTYTPGLYLAPDTSVGVASAPDGSVRVVVARSPNSFTELHARPADDGALISGFAVEGDTLVWMEATSRGTSLWRGTLGGGAPATQVTTDTGETSFAGLPTQVRLADGRVTWTAVAPTEAPRTDVRSVALSGGRVSWERHDGELLLSTPPWAVSPPGGVGGTVRVVNLDSGQTIEVPAAPNEAVSCSPTWCRVSALGEAGLTGTDLMRPDGTQRRTIAGADATPTVAEPVLLDRFVPLVIDRDGGVGLSVYDVAGGQTVPVALGAANVGGHGGLLWWSTGLGPELVWHALDLNVLS